MQKIKGLVCIGFSLIFMAASVHPAFAVKQKYKRYYQKKTPYYQDKKPYYQERDLPNSMARLEVSRKKAEVSTEYQSAETVFKIERPNVVCRNIDTLSCTTFGVSFSVETVCAESRITLTVKENPVMTVELSSLYPKGSCRFDHILKHELQHVRAYRTALKSVIENVEKKLVAEYTAGQDNSKRCEDIQKKITALVSDLNAQYSEKAESENARLDNEDGGHKYGFEACETLTEKTGNEK